MNYKVKNDKKWIPPLLCIRFYVRFKAILEHILTILFELEISLIENRNFTKLTYKVDLTFFLLINYSIHNNKKMQNRQIGLKPTALQIDSRKTRQTELV